MKCLSIVANIQTKEMFVEEKKKQQTSQSSFRDKLLSISYGVAWRIPETGSLVGCRLWGRTESYTTEVT